MFFLSATLGEFMEYKKASHKKNTSNHFNPNKLMYVNYVGINYDDPAMREKDTTTEFENDDNEYANYVANNPDYYSEEMDNNTAEEFNEIILEAKQEDETQSHLPLNAINSKPQNARAY